MKTSRLALTFTLAALLGVLSPGGARAATFIVGDLADDGTPGTLRYLLNNANDGDVIQIPGGTIVLTATGADIDADCTAPVTAPDLCIDLDVNRAVTIQGSSDPANPTIIDADGPTNSSRVIEVDSDDTDSRAGSLVLENVTIQNGQSSSGQDGGGILVNHDGSLHAIGCLITANKSDARGGGIANDSSNGNTWTILENSTVSNNVADDEGGAVSYYYGQGMVVNSIIKDNESGADGSGGGGAFYSDNGGVDIVNSKITGNKTGSSDGPGGGLYNEYGVFKIFGTGDGLCEISGNTATSDNGGGIANFDTIELENCLISDNKALGTDGGGDAVGGGGIYSENLITTDQVTIDGNKTEGCGGGVHLVLASDANGILIAERSTISNNVANVDSDSTSCPNSDPAGGGVYSYRASLILRDSLLVNNTVNEGFGGGFYDSAAGSIIENSTVAGNTAINGDGGGIYNDYWGLLLQDSTISGNKAVGDDGSDDSDGGGIWLSSDVSIVNSTIANNQADGNGGGIYADYIVRLLNVTVTGNVADANAGGLTDGDGGGLFNERDTGATIYITNTIVSGNQDASPGHEAPDCFNNFVTEESSIIPAGVNIIQDQAGCELASNSAAILAVDPLLDPAGLADNGGAVQGAGEGVAGQTILLQAGSPAIDAADTSLAPTTDQRGVERPQGAEADLGAVEGDSSSGGTTGGDTTGGDTTGGGTTGGTGDSGGGCALTAGTSSASSLGLGLIALIGFGFLASFRKKSSKAAGLLAAVLAVFGASNAMADCTTPVTHTVTNLAVDDGSPGTLRFLIGSPSVQDCDTIELPAGIVQFDAGSASPLLVDKKITIRGAGAGTTFIDANFPVTGFPAIVVDTSATGSALTLEGITVRNGATGVLVTGLGSLEVIDSEITGNAGSGLLVTGGDFNNLIVDNSTVSNNGAVAPVGGGIVLGFPAPSAVSAIITDSTITQNKNNDVSPAGGGGIIILGGDVQIFNSRITENDAAGNGGGILNIFGVLNITGSEISDNISQGGNGQGGGGIAALFETNIENCVISGNVTLNDTGGGGVGAIGDVNIIDSLIDGNRADGGGGGVTAAAGLNIFNSTISNNIANNDNAGPPAVGGGIFLVLSGTISESVISGNVIKSGVGGGIADGPGGFGGLLTITDSVIDGNTAVNGDGGGLLSDILPATIRNTTISNNKAQGGSILNGGDDALGGGIVSGTSAGALQIFNSTIAGNSADGDGGGIVSEGILSLSHVTITGNTADANSGGLTGGNGGGVNNFGGLSLNNTLIAGNVDASPGHEAPDCSNAGPPTTIVNVLSNNFIGDLTGCVITGNEGRILSGDALLDPAGLADNDGPSIGNSENAVVLKTVALQSGSPAIDAATDGSCPSEDERGVERPQGEHCDLGAFEGAAAAGGTTGGDTTGGDTTGGTTTGGGDGGGGCSLIR